MPFVKNGLETVAVLRHRADRAGSEPLNVRYAIELPASLTARGAISGTFCFEADDTMLEGTSYGAVELRVKLAAGMTIDAKHNLVLEILDAEDLEKKRSIGVPV